MKAAILAAGKGERMWPLTTTGPKGMLPVANKPILEHLVMALKEAGITDIIMVVGCRAMQIVAHFADAHRRFGVNIEYIYQLEQLGTGHAVSLLEGHVSDRFLVLNGDILVRSEDIRPMVSHGRMVIGVAEVENTNGLGMIDMLDGRRLANGGVYIFTPQIFTALKENSDLLVALQSGSVPPIWCHPLRFWCHISHPWDLLAANEALMEQSILIDRTSLSSLRPNVIIDEPVVIGPNCEIGPNCHIRPYTAIGDNCHIGAGVEIKNSIIMSGTKIPHQSYIGDSIIGENCNIGAGTVIANLRLDGKTVRCGGIDTGRRKLGAIIGDNVQIGVNCSIMPGVMIAPNSVIMPHTCIMRDIREKSPCAA